ncbi:MAG: hypothetical protein O2826_02840 [Chloroflexi bacterium]|nr:hypothetical protein [Chloroflexota bacterium]MDA1173437.1 hypothetical protein [Chloroflexota bacterium]
MALETDPTPQPTGTSGDEMPADNSAATMFMVGFVVFMGVLIVAWKVAGAMVATNNPVAGEIVFRTRILNHVIILLIGSVILASFASLPAIGLNSVVERYWPARTRLNWKRCSAGNGGVSHPVGQLTECHG